MRTIVAGATPIGSAIERVLRNRNFSRIRRIEDFRSAIDESTPGVVRTHRKVLRQALFQTELHGVIDRRRAIASLTDHAFSGIHPDCADGAGDRNIGIAVDGLKQGSPFGPYIAEGKRKVAGELALELK